MPSLLVTPRTPLDDHWHQQLLLLQDMPNDLYVYLMPTAADLSQLRERFEASNGNELPVLRPPEVHRHGFETSMAGLSALRTDIAVHEKNDHLRTLYIDRIDELIANCTMWLAAADGDYRAFETANEFLYGMPDAALHAASCAWLRDFAAAQLSHPDVAVRHAAALVLGCVPDLHGKAHLLVPDTNTYHAVRTMHTAPNGYADQLFANTALPDGGVITAATGDIIIEQVLATISAPYTIADAADNFWGVQHSTRSVLRPANYALSIASFTGLVMHEVGSHLLERMNGLRGPLRLAASGLDRYEKGNEGRAYLREQIMLGSVDAMVNHYSWKFSIAKHLAISVGVGVTGPHRTFKEVYDILYAIHLLWALLQQPDQASARTAAADASWAIATRVLKGTDGRGGAYRKDIVYLEGNARCWHVATTHPERILIGDYGKFDITNREHLRHLQALGAIPST